MLRLLPGDLVPDFILPASTNPSFNFALACGRYVVLSFFGSASLGPARRMLASVLAEAHRFDDVRASFYGVSVDPNDESQGVHLHHGKFPGIRFFWDFERQVSGLYGATELPPATVYRLFSVVLDPALRVIANVPFQHDRDHGTEIRRILDDLPDPGDYGATWMNAPILVVPNVFETSFCEELIALYERHGGEPSGFMREQDGLTVAAQNPEFKRRMDYTIADESVRVAARERLNRRLTRPIRAAFQFAATRLERYIVACYDAGEGGFFKPHQDNTTKGTAHRRFAVTINLNAEAYEGGDLRFPAFGMRTYRAPTGGAIVFSCSLIHEATPVTKGRRYAFLPFLYDEEGQRLREENLPFLALSSSPDET